jgi:hypothetical protein
MLKFLAIAALLLGAPAAYSQTVASCPTATPGSTWNPTTQWLKCSDLTYIAQPVPATTPVNDMHCGSTGCVFSWQLGPKVLPTDQVWVETTAKPKGTWVSASSLKFGGATQNCTRLIYIGAPQSYILKDNGASPSYNPPIVGIVTLTAPLVPNLTNALVTPAAWDFSTSQEGLYSGSSLVALTSSFVFSTDGQGNITEWDFSASYGTGTNPTISGRVGGTSTPSIVTTGGDNGTPWPGTYYDGVGKTDTSVLPPVFFYTLSVAIGSWYCLVPL